MTHTIRLRAAWRSDGRVRTRRFNKPTGLDGGERVWLAVETAAKLDNATLNGSPVEFSTSGRCDITDALRPSNELRLETEEVAALETVRLEIGLA